MIELWYNVYMMYFLDVTLPKESKILPFATWVPLQYAVSEIASILEFVTWFARHVVIIRGTCISAQCKQSGKLQIIADIFD